MSDGPISPPVVEGAGSGELPAYLSNGLIGLRLRPNPLISGTMMVAGFTGEHPVKRIEAAAQAPYPLALDLALDRVWISDMPSQARDIRQSYDFATGELTTEFVLGLADSAVRLTVLTFCSRDQPTIVCQEVGIELERAGTITLRVGIDGAEMEGRPIGFRRETAGEDETSPEGALLWESAGGIGKLGIAYGLTFTGAETKIGRGPWRDRQAITEVSFRGRAGRRYRLRQLASVVAGEMHRQPDYQAARLLGKAMRDGFDALRAANRGRWKDLWRSRIRLVGADRSWQALADAAFFYLNTSIHPSSPASTSMFGLATWHDYHYYYGHVMWDIESFALPPLALFQPEAAASLLGYRYGKLDAARRNAHLNGRRGLQFPWESSASSGEEAAPLPGTAAWYEDHASLDVALGFAFYANVSGEERYRDDYAWPVLSGVADWFASRVTETARGYETKQSMGIAERPEAIDNPAYANMAAKVMLLEAIETARQLGRMHDAKWADIAERLVIPRRGKVILSHDGYRRNEEKGETPDPLMGIFPVGFALPPDVERATLDFYLERADEYAGAPMLSALLGVWAARTGNRRLAAKLLDDGYGRFVTGRFAQTLEYRPDAFPEQPPAGPFIANIGGFLIGLLLGFPGLRPSSREPDTWADRPVVLPEGWEAIEVDALHVRRKTMRLVARHGAERAILEPAES